MPTKPKHPCNYPGCNQLTTERYCEKHKKQEQQRQDQQRGTATQRGYDANWRRIRRMILIEEPLCRECMKHGVIKPATDVHHIDGDVSTMNRDNLEPLCHECHSRHTAKHQGFGRGRGM